MSISVKLPRIIGSHHAALELLDVYEVGSDLRGETVHIFANNLSTTTRIFTDDLLRLLENSNPDEIIIFGAPREFQSFVDEVTERRDYHNVRTGTFEDLRIP